MSPIAQADIQPLPWHSEVWARLVDSFLQERPAHAVLLEGSTGTGRNRLARALTFFLLCERRSSDGACGQCKSCELQMAGSHTDYLALKPPEAGKGIGIDAVRDALTFLAATASLGRYKVLTLSPLERMSRAAFNAFLKGLEEPPPGTVLILVNARGYPIPATIRSRCQRWILKDPDEQAGMDWLADNLDPVQIPAGLSIDDLSRISPGRPLETQSLLENDGVEDIFALQKALEGLPGTAPGSRRPLLDRPASRVELDRLLLLSEAFLVRRARSLDSSQLRSARGRQLFAAIDLIGELRSARQAGTNPHPDLVRHRTVRALMQAMQ